MIAIFAVVLAVLFLFLHNGAQISLAFVVGAVNVLPYGVPRHERRGQVQHKDRQERGGGRKEAFWTAIYGGSVTGFAAVGFCLIGISLLLAYLAYPRSQYS